MKTLQEHYTAIKNGQGNKAQFLKQARSLFPEYFNQYTDFDTATNVLKSKQIISEAAGGVVAKGFDIWDWKKILAEETKSVEKETSKEVKDDQAHAFQPSDMKNVDNINFNEIMKGFFAEMYDAKNKEKTGDEIKAMVVKNLAKDPLYYTKNGNFSTMGVGYTDEAPGLGTNTQPKTKESTVLGGNDKVASESDIVKNSLVGSAKKNVQDSLGNSEAKTSMPKKVKEMPDKGVQGVEKKVRLKEEEIKWKRQSLNEDIEETRANTNKFKPYKGGSGKGGRRYIPSVSVLSQEAITAINDKGRKRMNWGKPHIKVLQNEKTGEIKLAISQSLLDAIVFSERGKPTNKATTIGGTGITSDETKEISPQFRELVKKLSKDKKLVQQPSGYYLLDIPTKYDGTQYKVPLAKDVAENLAEQKLRSLIQQIIKEEMNWDKFNIHVSSNNYEGTIKRDGEGWMMYDEDNQPEEAGPFSTLDSLMSYYDLSKDDLTGNYVKNLK